MKDATIIGVDLAQQVSLCLPSWCRNSSSFYQSGPCGDVSLVGDMVMGGTVIA
nr:hypothetical protein [Paracoccus aerius]